MIFVHFLFINFNYFWASYNRINIWYITFCISLAFLDQNQILLVWVLKIKFKVFLAIRVCSTIFSKINTSFHYNNLWIVIISWYKIKINHSLNKTSRTCKFPRKLLLKKSIFNNAYLLDLMIVSLLLQMNSLGNNFKMKFSGRNFSVSPSIKDLHTWM